MEIWKPIKGYETKYEISNNSISHTFNPLLNSSGIFDKDFENKKYDYLNIVF